MVKANAATTKRRGNELSTFHHNKLYRVLLFIALQGGGKELA